MLAGPARVDRADDVFGVREAARPESVTDPDLLAASFSQRT